MSYIRVLPRDLFNDANLLKCCGALWVALETFNNDSISVESDDEPFDIHQSSEDGSTWVSNLELTVHGRLVGLFRPMNDRDTHPLWFRFHEEEGLVLTEQGELHRDFLKLVSDMEVCDE